jgi:CRP-like cAMP-binding protein
VNPPTLGTADLTRTTSRLRAHPTDHGAWLELAGVLSALGHPDEAEQAFVTVGEAARAGGQVALAVACGRHLAQLGSVAGTELLDQVVDTYAAQSVGTAAESPPPVPPKAGTSPPPAPKAGARVITDDAVADARAVIAVAGAAIGKLAPATHAPAPLLSALSKSGARALIGVMTARAFAAGQPIIDIGEPATALYWLAFGDAGVQRDGTELGELHSGALFGEIALVGGTRRTARVSARDDVWVLEIPARAVEQAAAKQPHLAEVLAYHARARLLANLTRTSELFSALDDADRTAVFAKLTTELVQAGHRVIREGERNDSLWVVVSGRCEVRSTGGAIAQLGPGSAVGEISLVSGAHAVADVVATEPAVLLRLKKPDFEIVAKRHPQLLAAVEKLVVARETANRALFADASDLIV